MSGFVALFHPDGHAAEASRLLPLLSSLAHRAPDGFTTWIHGPVALGHARLVVSSESARPQPLVAGDDAIVFAGRLDNREELAADLPAAAGEGGDAALALAAFRAWGEESTGRLLGDFAFAIWDGARRRLVCARDALGQKPLYYHATPRLVIVASEPRAILADPDVPRAADEGVVAEYLAGIIRSREATLNAAVRRLLPGHLLIAAAEGWRIRRYWNVDGAREIRYARDDEYAEHLQELLSRAVDCRIRGTAAAGVFLSGGLDSSAVVAVAARRAPSHGCALEALALRFPGRSCDEGPFIEAVARHTGVPLRNFEMVPAPATSYRQEASAWWDVPEYPNGTILQPLREAARQAGLRVVLTGYGGDEWFAGSTLHTADLLREGRLLSAWRQLRADASLPGRGFRAWTLARGAVAPLLPVSIRRAATAWREPPSYEWIRPEFQRRIALHDRLQPQPVNGFRNLATANLYDVATSGAQLLGDELEERAAAAAGIEQRHPFNDRRIVEFGLALPESQRWRGRDTKVVLRRAMELGRLAPPEVLARDDKAEFSSTYVDGLEALGGAEAFSRLRTEEQGWVDGEKARNLYARMMSLYTRADEAYISLSGALWSILSLELWLDAIAPDPHGVIHHRRSGGER